MLKLEMVEAGYGQAKVLNSVSLEINEKETVALIGSNGAGKSTILKTIVGLLKPVKGEGTFFQEDIFSQSPDKICQLGIALVPEGRRLFAGMTVYDNLMMGAYLSKDKKAIKRKMDYVMDIFPTLQDRKGQLAGTLSGGEQQMCSIGRALMSDPKLILIDELSLGLSPAIVSTLLTLLEKMKHDGITILLVEQDVQVALGISDRGYVLEQGAIAMEGKSSMLLNDERIRKSYLGM